MATIELNGAYYAIKGEVEQTYLTRLASAFRPRGVQVRTDDTSVNRYVHRNFPLGLGWARMNRETGRGVGGMLHATAWTSVGPVSCGKLDETQTHTSPKDHLKKAVNFKNALWGAFEQNYSSTALNCSCVATFAGSNDTWSAVDVPLFNASATGTQASGGTTITVSHTVQSTYGNRIVVAFVFLYNGVSLNDPTGVTYAGVAMTKLTSKSQSNQNISLWYLVNPTTGVNNCVSTSVTGDDKVMAVADYYFVNQTTPFGTAQTGGSAAATSTSVTAVTTAQGDLVIGGVAHNANEATAVGANLFERTDTASTNVSGEYSEGRAVAATTTWAASWVSNVAYAAVAAPLLATGYVSAPESEVAFGTRIFDMVAHKSSLFILRNENLVPTESISEVTYKVVSSSTGDDWVDASGPGWPDSATTNRYLTTTITRRNTFDDDMGRLLSWGNSLVAAIYRHPSSTDGNGTVEVLSSTDSGTNWTSRATVPSAGGPKALVDWLTLAAVRSPVLIIPDGVYSIDIVNNTFSLIYPLDGDPNTGRWSTVGADGALYVGLGSGSIVRLNIPLANVLEVIVIGPPGDGLVTAAQGRANWILSTPSEWLFVAYGGHIAATNASIFMIDTSTIYTNPETGKKFMAWHPFWEDTTANEDIIALAYSTADDSTVRLHFAIEGTTASSVRHIEEALVNPTQSTTAKYRDSTYIRLPVDDLGDPQTNAIITQGLVDADSLSADTTGQYITHQYGLDGAVDTTTTLGNYLSGTKSLSFGTGAAGVAAKTIGNRLIFRRNATNTNRPLLNEWELQAHNLLLGRRAWTFTIDIAESVPLLASLTANTPPEETVITNLLTAATATTLITFTIGRMTQTRVRVPTDSPPVFHLEILNSRAQRLGQRSGTVTMRVEEGI